MVKNQEFTIHYSLEEIQKVYERNPQLQQLKCIVISGTNGKGSTARFLEMMLRKKGKKVGKFTSPSITVMNDMYMVNEEAISDAQLKAYLAEAPSQLSLFEQQVIIALRYFVAQQVDYAILEVGMGGTYDAVNIVERCLTLCTNIGHDHHEYLGHTLESIAKHKAGIARRHVPFLTSEHDPLKQYFLRHHVQHVRGCFLWVQDDETYDYASVAHYQKANFSLAKAGFEELFAPLSEKEYQEILHQFEWMGRFEKVEKDASYILDGAHNVEGIKALIPSLKKDCVIVFSALKDKPYQEMLALLHKVSKNIIVTSFDDKRSCSAKELASGVECLVEEEFPTALALAKTYQKEIVVVGSLHFIGMVRSYLKRS